MKKGQILEGTVQRIDFPNKGVIETEEGVCVVKNALPGQRVSFVVSKIRKGRAEGRLLRILESSPLECASPCPHFGSCGGCTYLSLPYEEQLRIKEAQVKKLLDSVLDGQPSWQFEGIKASPAVFGYRNKMEFSFGDEVKDGPLALGMHKRGSFYDIVSVTGCQIVDADYRRILRCVQDYFTRLQEQGMDIGLYHRLRHTGYLRHLLVRKAAKTGEILIALVTTTQLPGVKCVVGSERKEAAAKECTAGYQSMEAEINRRDTAAIKTTNAAEISREKKKSERQKIEDEILEGFQKELLAMELAGKIVGILHVRNDAVADVIRSDETRILYGQDFFYEELLGLRFKVSAFSFFQTNSRGAEVLYQTVREYVAGYIGTERNVPHERSYSDEGECAQDSDSAGECAASDEINDKIVYDLYSGTGTIAQLMAPVAGKVIGVEIVEEAVESARKNAELNGLHNCDFIAGDVLKVLDMIDEKPDIIILDPPRDGVHPKALDKIIRYGVEHILYISCKPTSLVRDLEVFVERGYEVERAVGVDQFPWTGNVETVCLLSNRKSKPDTHVKLSLSMDDYYRIKERGKDNQ